MSGAKTSAAPSWNTADRIRAYLASMRPLEAGEWREDIEAGIQRGHSLIERLALSAKGEDQPTMKLSPAQCADVLTYMSCVEPIDGASWWDSDLDIVSHICGYNAILDAMSDSLREIEAAS
jgi:hypothetical protein